MTPPKKKIRLMAEVLVEELYNSNIYYPVTPLILNDCFNYYPLFSWIPLAIEDDEHIRIANYCETWIHRYLEYDFYLLFRVNRKTFRDLLSLIGSNYTECVHRGGANLPLTLEKQLLITLLYLSRGETLHSISDRFNVAVKTSFNSISVIINIFAKIKSDIIKWPTEIECNIIMEDFKQIAGFPGIIGAIDGCHFKAKVPVHQQDSYQDRNFNHSISMQAICIKSMYLTNISVGYPGSLHDARILKESNLHRAIFQTSEESSFYGKYHLVGDSAYPCKSWLLTPYRDTGYLNIQQRKYNYHLSKSRVVIEHTFGQLKGRWRILQHINVYTIERASQIIIACCCLHNFCIKQKDYFNETELYQETSQTIPSLAYDEYNGISKRDGICQYLYISNK